jgi:hypothetical protein
MVGFSFKSSIWRGCPYFFSDVLVVTSSTDMMCWIFPPFVMWMNRCVMWIYNVLNISLHLMWCVESSLPHLSLRGVDKSMCDIDPWFIESLAPSDVMCWIFPLSLSDVENQYMRCWISSSLSAWGLCCHHRLRWLLCGVGCSLLFLRNGITTLDSGNGNSCASLCWI